MQQVDIAPSEIGTWAQYRKAHPEPLEDVVRREGWRNIPRVPVYPLPEGHRHRYVLIDGHGRHHGATQVEMPLPCNVYAPDEVVDIVRDALAPFRYAPTFERVLAIYLHAQSPLRTSA